MRVFCRRHDDARYYQPSDLIQIFGDVDVNQLDRCMKCERCGQRDNIDVDVRLPSGMELDKIKIRRLVEIKIYKRPVWWISGNAWRQTAPVSRKTTPSVSLCSC